MTLLDTTIHQIQPHDSSARRQARRRLEQLTMPHWALGRLLDLAEELSGIAGAVPPAVARKAVVVMAADHGVAGEGVSQYPQEVTLQMVGNFLRCGAGINALANQCGARVVVVDMGVAGDLAAFGFEGQGISKRIGPGTRNLAVEPAMSREEAVRSVEAGIEVAQELALRTDVFGTGEMGIANTTASTAILAAISAEPVARITGRGTGIDDARLAKKINVIEQSLALHQPDPKDGLDLLAKVGGFEIGGLAGLILGAASLRKPVVVDGFISTAAALIAARLCPLAAEYMIAAHRSQEPGHALALQCLGKQPLLDLDLRLGEGTGAALAMNLVEAAVRVLTEVATFEEASVSRAESR